MFCRHFVDLTHKGLNNVDCFPCYGPFPQTRLYITMCVKHRKCTFLQCPEKKVVVSQPVKTWNGSHCSALSFPKPLTLIMSCLGMHFYSLLVPNFIHALELLIGEKCAMHSSRTYLSLADTTILSGSDDIQCKTNCVSPSS